MITTVAISVQVAEMVMVVSARENIQTALGNLGRIKIVACLARDPLTWFRVYVVAKAAS